MDEDFDIKGGMLAAMLVVASVMAIGTAIIAGTTYNLSKSYWQCTQLDTKGDCERYEHRR
jgi:hypothetical protein